MSEYEDKLKAKQDDLRQKLQSLATENNNLIDQRKEIDRRLGLVREEIVRLQGALREINEILGVDEPQEEKAKPKSKIPKKRKEN